MRYGIACFPQEMKESVAAAVDVVSRAEAAGFAEAWIPDSQGIWRDPYVVTALCVPRTRTIVLGLGVTNPVTRHPMVTARAMLTLQEASAGRAVLGLGAGDTALTALGLRPVPVGRCAEYVEAVRALMDGGETVWDGARLRLDNRGDAPRVPIYLAANGPRMLRLAGRAADGVIVPIGITQAYVEYVRHHVGEGLRDAGRGRGAVDVAFLLGCSVSGEREVARAQSRTWVAKRALVPVPPEVSGIGEREAREFAEAYRYQEHLDVGAGHARLVPDAWIDRFALAGTAAEVAAKVASLASWGAEHLLLLPATRDTGGLITEFAATIISRGPGR